MPYGSDYRRSSGGSRQSSTYRSSRPDYDRRRRDDDNDRRSQRRRDDSHRDDRRTSRRRRSNTRSRSRSLDRPSSLKRSKPYRPKSRSRSPVRNHRSTVYPAPKPEIILPATALQRRRTVRNERNADSKPAPAANFYHQQNLETIFFPSTADHTYEESNTSQQDDEDGEDFDKERIHQEMQERLRVHLAREGKIYPPPKPQANHPIFANDGSFMEMFKKIQEQQTMITPIQQSVVQRPVVPAPQPQFGKRRGGKILKTGLVQKPKPIEEMLTEDTPRDAWSVYLQEVKKYKSVSCSADSKTRPLVK